MKITGRGVVFEGMYLGGSPSTEYCSFTDSDGATFLIEAATIVRMYELVKFDLDRQGSWEDILNKLELK